MLTRLSRIGPAVVLVVGLLSGCWLFGPLFSPQLILSVALTDADSYYGFFAVAVYIENTGGETAQNLDYELFILGSAGSPIAYDLWEDDSDYPSAVGAGSTRLASFMGGAITYVPYYFELYIYYEDLKGNVYGPATVEGSLNPH